MFIRGLMKTYTVKTVVGDTLSIQADYVEKDATTYIFNLEDDIIAYFPIPQVVYVIEGIPQAA